MSAPIRALFRLRLRLAALVLALTALVCGLPLALAACATSPTAATHGTEQPLFAKDANGTAITIPSTAPQRIVSLGPTDSEILAGLHLDSTVLAVDYYTDYPADMAAKTKITDANGTANVEAIVGLKPDLVLSYGGETVKTDQQLERAGVTVVDLPATNLAGSIKEIRLVGQLTRAEGAANALADSLQRRIDAVKAKVDGKPAVSVYMEVDDSTPGKPYAFGGGSFGDELIRDAGGTNIFTGDTAGGGYPQVSDESIIAANPQVIILTEDPNYGGNPSLVYQRTGWNVISAVQSKRVYAISPDLTQRPGPRIVDGLEQLAKLLHPDLFG